MECFGLSLFERRVFIVFELDIGIEVGIEGTKLFGLREVEWVGYQRLRDAIFDFETRGFGSREIMAIGKCCKSSVVRWLAFVLYLYDLAVGKELS